MKNEVIMGLLRKVFICVVKAADLSFALFLYWWLMVMSLYLTVNTPCIVGLFGYRPVMSLPPALWSV